MFDIDSDRSMMFFDYNLMSDRYAVILNADTDELAINRYLYLVSENFNKNKV